MTYVQGVEVDSFVLGNKNKARQYDWERHHKITLGQEDVPYCELGYF